MPTIEAGPNVLLADTVGAAGARCIIKRTLRKMQIQPSGGPETYIGWFVAHPWACTVGIEWTIESSARAWTRGNNSGDSDTLAREEANCARLRSHVETLMAAIGVAMDWPGLYPTYRLNGRGYYSLGDLWAAMK